MANIQKITRYFAYAQRFFSFFLEKRKKSGKIRKKKSDKSRELARGSDTHQRTFYAIGGHALAGLDAYIAAIEVVYAYMRIILIMTERSRHNIGLSQLHGNCYITAEILGEKVAEVEIADNGACRRQHIHSPFAGEAAQIRVKRMSLAVGQDSLEIVPRGIQRLTHADDVGNAAENHGYVVVGMV